MPLFFLNEWHYTWSLIWTGYGGFLKTLSVRFRCIMTWINAKTKKNGLDQSRVHCNPSLSTLQAKLKKQQQLRRWLSMVFHPEKIAEEIFHATILNIVWFDSAVSSGFSLTLPSFPAVTLLTSLQQGSSRALAAEYVLLLLICTEYVFWDQGNK